MTLRFHTVSEVIEDHSEYCDFCGDDSDFRLSLYLLDSGGVGLYTRLYICLDDCQASLKEQGWWRDGG